MSLLSCNKFYINIKQKICFILFFIIILLCIAVDAKYTITKSFNIKGNSPAFYLESQIDKSLAELDINQAEFLINIQNYISEEEYNTFDVTYEITLDSEDFEIEINDTNSSVITSGAKDNEVTVVVKAIDVPNLELEKNLELKLNILSPYKKEIVFPITIINSSYLIGKYVNYDVAYTDIYTSYEFTSEDGWRILDPGTRNGDGTYSNTKLITTGIPMKLYYNSQQNPATTSNQNSKWWGTYEQVNERYGLSLTSWVSSYSRYFAAYGLEYNFESVPFSATTNTTKNKGYYTSITNDEATSTTTGAIFLNSTSESVHAVTVEEMNKELNSVNGNTNRTETKLGTVNASVDLRSLFYLKALNNYNYSTSSSTTTPYWLGSPNDDSIGLVRFQTAGTFAGGTDNTYGIRPVVVLNTTIYNEDGNWKISDTEITNEETSNAEVDNTETSDAEE